MTDELGIVVKIPKDFDLKLKQYMLNLEKIGVKTTKADLLLELAITGLIVKSQSNESDNL